MSSANYQELLELILQEIEQDSFALPTLPSVAANIQTLIDDPNVSVDQIVAVLNSDPFISAQIIKSANSAAYMGKPKIDNVLDAAIRLGYRQLRNLVITITMNNMLYSKNPVINRQMQETWEHSRKVAALSYVLALEHQHLSPDQAMLAGLMHDIGVLPLCMHIEKHHVPIEESTLASLIIKCHVSIGTKLLNSWHFQQEIVEVVPEHENTQRASTRDFMPDYADVVMFANLQAKHNSQFTDWNSIPAINRLRLSEDKCRSFIDENAERIEQVEVLLGMKKKERPKLHRVATNTTLTYTSPTSPQKKYRGGLLSYLFSFWK
ncbi:MAG: HDOD domain-containing protein [Gallionellaceae bacterium]